MIIRLHKIHTNPSDIVSAGCWFHPSEQYLSVGVILRKINMFQTTSQWLETLESWPHWWKIWLLVSNLIGDYPWRHRDLETSTTNTIPEYRTPPYRNHGVSYTETPQNFDMRPILDTLETEWILLIRCQMILPKSNVFNLIPETRGSMVWNARNPSIPLIKDAQTASVSFFAGDPTVKALYKS